MNSRKMQLKLLYFFVFVVYMVLGQPETPALQSFPSNNLVNSSQNVTLICLPSSIVSGGVFRFYFNRTLISVQSSNDFILNGGKGSVSGDYTCSYSYMEAESKKSNSVNLIFSEPPTISTTSTNPNIGDSITFTCNTNVQQSNMTFSWLKGNIVEKQTLSPSYTKVLASTDAGAYKCYFELPSFKSLESPYFNVVFYAPPTPKLTVAPSSSVVYGTRLTLSCEAQQSTPYDLLWCVLYKNNTKVSQKSVASLTTTFTEAALYRSSGSYSCQLVNKRGESVISAVVAVSVTSLDPATPKLIASVAASRLVPQDIICNHSYSLNQALYCTLYLNNKRYVDDEDCNFRLPHGISGYLNCSVTTESRSSNVSLYTAVTFFEEPSVLPLNTSPPVQNQRYTLRCIVDMEGPISWFMNYNSDQPVAVNTSTYNALIRSIDVKNAYQCVLTKYSFLIKSVYYVVYSSFPSTPTLTIQTDIGYFRNKSFTTFICSSPESGDTFSLYKNDIKVFEKPGNNSAVFVNKVGKNGAFYSCTTTNGYGESKQSSPVYVPGLNQLYITASSPLQALGQELSLSCSMKNPPTNVGLQYSWTIIRVNTTLSQSIVTQVLAMLSLTEKDQGLYSCQAKINDQVIHADNYYLITFTVPPAPELISSSSLTSATVVVQCFIQSLIIDIGKTFKLYRNGAIARNIPYEDQLSFNNGFNFWRFYTIDASLASNEGIYTCKSQNLHGESEPSNAVSLTRNTAFTKPTISPSTPTPSIGGSITLTCITPSPSTNDYLITWQKDFYPIMKTGTLTLTSLQPEDDGYYNCAFEFLNSQGTRIKLMSDSFYLLLCQPLQPSLVFDPAYLQLNLDAFPLGDGPIFYVFGFGETVHVLCLSQVPHINDTVWKTWQLSSPHSYLLYQNGVQVSSRMGGAFAINSLPQGSYNFTCQALSSTSFSELSYPLTVKVTARPIIQDYSSNLVNRTLFCGTSGTSNGFDIIWRKNGMVQRERSQYLRLSNVSPADEGKYSCRQQSGPWFLAPSENFVLTIGNKPAPPDTLGNDLSEIGSPGVISCVSTSSTAFTAVFYKNSVAVATTTEHILDEGGQIVFTYTIPSLAATDSGVYTCTVENRQGVSDQTSFADVMYVGQCSNNPCEQLCQENQLGTSFSCSCQAGSQLTNDRRTCQACDSSHYGDNCSTVCACNVENSVCDKVSGNCSCHQGWEGSTCDNDTDECAMDSNACNNASNCINTHGAFQCLCPAGYYSTGMSCQDVDECVNDPCKLKEVCNNLNGSYQCFCKQGYQQNETGSECFDIDECEVSNPCNQSCSNTDGGYVCSCSTGYMMNEYHRCVSVYSRGFEIHYPSVTPSAFVLASRTNESWQIISEIHSTVGMQLKKLARGYLDINIQKLKQGSLVAEVVVYLNKDSHSNLGGYLTKALTSMNMSELTISGIRQPDSYIVVGPMKISWTTPQCELRFHIDACAGTEQCFVDDNGISFCDSHSNFATLTSCDNVYGYLGLGMAVGAVAGGALSITIIIIFFSFTSKEDKKTKLPAKNSDSFRSKKIPGQQSSQPTSQQSSLTYPDDQYQPAPYFKIIKRANLTSANYREEFES